ncbi:MAG: OmpH family outer membrane protein [Saprospiraceae bacterium]|nr:OmpH family outer membrane protein [Saprospiraceae bacterium]MBP7699192.1 OmpH family outer membrane protein [Saprospiraceae bacterium]
MKAYNTILVLFALFLVNTTTSYAQKYGHINSGNLLEMMPEVQQANDSLMALQKSLLSAGEQMVKAFEVKYRALEADVNAGNISQIDRQKREDDLRKEQETIQQYETEMQSKLNMKREALLSPLLNKMKDAIQTVAKEGGYNMIFDESVGVLLFANQADDITAAVKTKLNIK